MFIDSFDLNKEILIVAEIGNNHEGKYEVAEKLIRLAARSGAGAVKFQTFKTEYYVSKKNINRFNQLKSFELTYEEFEKLSNIAKEEGLLFLSTPFDIESAKFLNSIVSAFKISSGDNDFYPLLEIVAHTGKPIILSSGLANIVQIKYSKAFIEKIWQEYNIKQELAVLHCVTSYPVIPQEANIAAIRTLKNELKCTTGYSDHTIGIDAASLSVALGARIIEKHFTIDKSYSNFKDHMLSADPEEFTQLVQKIKEISVLLGTGEKILQKSELNIVTAIKRSIVAKHDLQSESEITWDDITWIRAEGGLPAGKEHLILGKKIKASAKMGEILMPEDFYKGCEI
jgi:sialic acid synthase SpsE